MRQRVWAVPAPVEAQFLLARDPACVETRHANEKWARFHKPKSFFLVLTEDIGRPVCYRGRGAWGLLESTTGLKRAVSEHMNLRSIAWEPELDLILETHGF